MVEFRPETTLPRGSSSSSSSSSSSLPFLSSIQTVSNYPLYSSIRDSPPGSEIGVLALSFPLLDAADGWRASSLSLLLLLLFLLLLLLLLLPTVWLVVLALALRWGTDISCDTALAELAVGSTPSIGDAGPGWGAVGVGVAAGCRGVAVGARGVDSLHCEDGTCELAGVAAPIGASVGGPAAHCEETLSRHSL